MNLVLETKQFLKDAGTCSCTYRAIRLLSVTEELNVYSLYCAVRGVLLASDKVVSVSRLVVLVLL